MKELIQLIGKTKGTSNCTKFSKNNSLFTIIPFKSLYFNHNNFAVHVISLGSKVRRHPSKLFLLLCRLNYADWLLAVTKK